MPRRRTIPSSVTDIIKCSNEDCCNEGLIHYAELTKCEPLDGGGTICSYKCNNCGGITKRKYII